MSDIDVAVGDAVDSAQQTFAAADKNPLGQGFASMTVDGRTKLATVLQNHPDVNADDTSYVTIDGVQQYLSAQRAAYRAFVETLEDYGVETDHVRISGHLD